MNLEQAIATARPLAQHCAELTDRGPRPEERAEQLVMWRRDLARDLAEDFSSLLSGSRLQVDLAEPKKNAGKKIFDAIGPVAANCLLRCGSDDHTLLFSVDYATAVALTDRSFGGDGAVSDEAPEQMPRSAALFIDQAAELVAKAVARVSGIAGTSLAPAGDVIVRSENAARLKAFDADTECLMFVLTISETGGNEWKAKLALPADRLESFLASGSGSATGSVQNKALGTAASSTFDAIPLPIEAVLAEFDLSLGQLDRLAAGEEFPLAMPREIPLRIGAKTFAHGNLGTLEDRLALRLTRVPMEGGNI